MNKTEKSIIIVLISIFITLFLNMNTLIGVPFLERFNGNSVLYLIEAVIIAILLNKIYGEKNKRLIIVSCIVGFVLATAEIIGISLEEYSKLSIPKVAIFKWFAYFSLFTSIIIWLYRFIDSYKSNENIGKIRSLIDNKKSILVIALIILVFWMPYFIKFYPGILSPDSISQMNQVAEIQELGNHHPVFHTILISLFVKIGTLFGDYNTGVAVYSIFQMITMSLIFSFTVYYLNKKKLPILIIILAFLFFTIYPIMGIYSVTMWKDILFGGVMLLYTICITELVVNKNKLMSSKILMIFFSIIVLLIMLLRNNGIYIIILSLPFLLLLNKDIWKKLIVVFVIPVVCYLLITGPLFNILDVKKGSIGEALSIPIQQLTRVAKLERDTLTDEEYDLINKYIKLDNVDYNPRLSDPAKNNFDNVLFNENKMEFISLWAKLFLKYPIQYVESFLCNSYGYWYPETIYWIYSTGVQRNSLGIESKGLTDLPTMEILAQNRTIPIHTLLYSIGFMVWLVFISLMYMIYKKKYRYLSIFIGIIGLWITILASPVYCEYRYMFGLVTSLPILLSLPFLCKNKIKEK